MARVHVVGLRARGWRGHDEVEGEGFASHPVGVVQVAAFSSEGDSWPVG